MDQYASLTAAGAGEYERLRRGDGYSLVLRRIERVEDRAFAHRLINYRSRREGPTKAARSGSPRRPNGVRPRIATADRD